jgi:class 3 adenylate cyclase
MLPIVREMAERYTGIPAWRCALANLHAELGNEAEARVAFDRAAADDFAQIPRDAQWLISLSLLAEAAAYLRDDRAARLHELILPFDGLELVAGRAAACYGPVARTLGLLAHASGRLDDAERHFRSALELCARMGDRPFAARTRYELAALLLERDRRGDREQALELLGECLDAAQEMGMRLQVERAVALRLEAQGISSLDVTTTIDFVISAVESERPNLAAHAAPDGTVTILFSDIENSTLMTERLGDERWLDVLRAHNSIFRRHLRAHGGYEVKNQGDGFMLVFPDAREALACAVAIQRELSSSDAPDDERVRVRMGMHTGEAIREEGDFFGRSVILAARIAAQAGGGEILVSEALKEHAEGPGEDGEADGFDFGAQRDLELKGLAGTHRVYMTEWDAEPAPA